jgi:hypothetical protein
LVRAFSQSEESQVEETRLQFLNSIETINSTLGKNWAEESRSIFKERAEAMLNIAYKDSKILREYETLKTLGDSINGQNVAVGVTIYGGPDWDFTTFLDIKPAQRPPDLVSYWTSKGYNIASQEAKLSNRGIKTGTLNLSDAYKGAYGRALRVGFSCASTRFPGGTQLQLRNQDGSIYDPAGLNPSGIVTVDDTGNAELTYKKVDLFISREYADHYKTSNMNGVIVSLVSKGVQTAPQYVRAQKKFGSMA